MEEPEYLTTTRARRANAGTRLKQLVEMEAASESQVQQFVNDDDENVNLLFQEDENDVEFVESESESEQDASSGDEEEAGENTDEKGGKTDEIEESEVEQVNSDDVLSDSDISASDDDHSEGEKELEKQEKAKKRKLKQKNKLIPAIKKFKTAEEKAKKSKPKLLITSDSLVNSTRRSSSRKSAITNKEALVQRLKEDEERRAKIAPVIRPKERELTQEERLAQAVETEKANLISLELFREQEVFRKEKQKALLMARRVRLRNVVRFVSQEVFIAPGDAIEEQRQIYYAIHNKSRRKNIRKIRRLANFDITKFPGGVDTQLPYVKAELLKKEQEKAKNNELNNGTTEPNVKTQSENNTNAADDKNGSITGTSEASHAAQQRHGESIENGTSTEQTEKATELSKEATPDASKKQEKQETPQAQATADVASEVKKEASADIDKEKKKVTFASDVKPHNDQHKANSNPPAETETAPSNSENETSAEPEETNEVFEGPVQKLIRNIIYLEEFDKTYDLTDLDFLREAIFGKDASLPGSRRFKDLKPILRIGGAHNPYAKVKEEKDELFLPVSDLTEEDSMFEELNRLPKLGVRQEIIEEVEEVDENDGAIVLKTEAPTGLYLPNGNKKFCLITSNEVKYFDTATGVPYYDVDTYKFLKSIEVGNIPWYTIDGEYNDTGPTEIYLGSRDGSVRHARGVPEGFDG